MEKEDRIMNGYLTDQIYKDIALLHRRMAEAVGRLEECECGACQVARRLETTPQTRKAGVN